jgi:hypothetical protein
MQPHLLPLFRDGPTIRFRPFDVAHPLPPSQCDIEITELDFALRASPADTRIPYLEAPCADLEPGVIGLCHAAGEWDPDRSLPQDLLHDIYAERRCITLSTERSMPPVLNPAGCPTDIMATAALVRAVDLVITVDTMIAHLAGALGKPTWLLLKSEPDWRWPVKGRSTPWYPTMRIYAQPEVGQWRTVVERVRDDLAALANSEAERS